MHQKQLFNKVKNAVGLHPDQLRHMQLINPYGEVFLILLVNLFLWTRTNLLSLMSMMTA